MCVLFSFYVCWTNEREDDLFFACMSQTAASQWARKRNLRVASKRHGIVCQRSRSILMVDFVFESKQRKLSHKNRYRPKRSDGKMGNECHCILASVFFSGLHRGGPLLAYAQRYARAVKEVCNRDMDFFPSVMSLCVYGRDTILSEGTRARVWAQEVR